MEILLLKSYRRRQRRFRLIAEVGLNQSEGLRPVQLYESLKVGFVSRESDQSEGASQDLSTNMNQVVVGYSKAAREVEIRLPAATTSVEYLTYQNLHILVEQTKDADWNQNIKINILSAKEKRPELRLEGNLQKRGLSVVQDKLLFASLSFSRNTMFSLGFVDLSVEQAEISIFKQVEVSMDCTYSTAFFSNDSAYVFGISILGQSDCPSVNLHLVDVVQNSKPALQTVDISPVLRHEPDEQVDEGYVGVFLEFVVLLKDKTFLVCYVHHFEIVSEEIRKPKIKALKISEGEVHVLSSIEISLPGAFSLGAEYLAVNLVNSCDILIFDPVLKFYFKVANWNRKLITSIRGRVRKLNIELMKLESISDSPLFGKELVRWNAKQRLLSVLSQGSVPAKNSSGEYLRVFKYN